MTNEQKGNEQKGKHYSTLDYRNGFILHQIFMFLNKVNYVGCQNNDLPYPSPLPHPLPFYWINGLTNICEGKLRYYPLGIFFFCKFEYPTLTKLYLWPTLPQRSTP